MMVPQPQPPPIMMMMTPLHCSHDPMHLELNGSPTTMLYWCFLRRLVEFCYGHPHTSTEWLECQRAKWWLLDFRLHSKPLDLMLSLQLDNTVAVVVSCSVQLPPHSRAKGYCSHVPENTRKFEKKTEFINILVCRRHYCLHVFIFIVAKKKRNSTVIYLTCRYFWYYVG